MTSHAPFFTADLGWIWLGVTEAWSTLVASLLPSSASKVGGAAADGHLFGDVLAFGMTFCMATMMLINRLHHDIPMLPTACLSALLGRPLLVWPFAAPFDVSMLDLLKLCLFGTTQFGLRPSVPNRRWSDGAATENALINTWRRRWWSPGSASPRRRQSRTSAGQSRQANRPRARHRHI